jgi:ribosomal protein S18 acetylase RimI-like enzyme
MSIEVREARPDEYGEAGEVTALAYGEFARPDDDWREYLALIADIADRAARTTILVAVEDGRVLGSLTLELADRVERHDRRDLDPEEAHIRMLGVHPDARRRGIARLLLDRAMAEARGAGKTLVTLHTTERMLAARAMYESLGFEPAPDHVFPDGFVLLGYRKSLVEEGPAGSELG